MGFGIPFGFHISWCFSTQPRCTGPHFGCTITDIQTTKERDCGHQVTMSAASTRDPWQRLRRMLRKKPLLLLWNIQINQVECVTKAHLSSKKRSFFSGFRFFGTTWFYGCFFVFINPLTIGWFPYFFLHVPHPITDRLQAVSSSILRTSTSCPQGPDEVKATAPQGVWAGCNFIFSTARNSHPKNMISINIVKPSRWTLESLWKIYSWIYLKVIVGRMRSWCHAYTFWNRSSWRSPITTRMYSSICFHSKSLDQGWSTLINCEAQFQFISIQFN